MRCATCGAALRLEWEDYWSYIFGEDESPEEFGCLDDDDYHKYDNGEWLASGGYTLRCTENCIHETGYAIDENNYVVRKDE